MTGLARFAVLLAGGILAASAPSLAQSSASFGAVASTKPQYRMEYGTADGQADASSAVDAAIADCEMRAGVRGACEKHVAFRNRCAAVATADDHTGAAEYAMTPAAAGRLAVTLCEAGGTRRCKIVKSFCSF